MGKRRLMEPEEYIRSLPVEKLEAILEHTYQVARNCRSMGVSPDYSALSRQRELLKGLIRERKES